MTDQDVIAALRAKPGGPTAIVGVTLFGEARGTGPAERAGIAAVISNRVKAQRSPTGKTFFLKDVPDFNTSQVWLVPDLRLDRVQSSEY